MNEHNISIHALRAERDILPFKTFASGRYFNPRAPSGARRRADVRRRERVYFNPRAPSGARRRLSLQEPQHLLISIHALRAERDSVSTELDTKIPISIHALRAERDLVDIGIFATYNKFQSTRSERSATCAAKSPDAKCSRFQSTRSERSATLAGRNPDTSARFQSTRSERSATLTRGQHFIREKDFNPRAPSGARHFFK